MAGPSMSIPGCGTLLKGTWAAGQVFWQLPLLPELLPCPGTGPLAQFRLSTPLVWRWHLQVFPDGYKRLFLNGFSFH